MCGIWGVINQTQDIEKLFKLFMTIKPRGPDQSNFLTVFNNIIGFHRLAIIDNSPNGDQPFKYIINNDDNTLRVLYLTVNGEIYNHKVLRNACSDYDFQSHSDCEVIIPLFLKYNMETVVKMLDGEFAFALHDITYHKKENKTERKLYLARDRFGIRPLFYTYDKNTFCYSSEMKGLDPNIEITVFKPRHWMEVIQTDDNMLLNSYSYYNLEKIPISIRNEKDALYAIYQSLYDAVKSHLESERDIACLLSGGLDSSLVSAIASDILKKENKKLYTFSIGMNNSPDAYYAQMVANHIGSIHTNVEIPEEEWINAIEDVVKISETYDITTIRATTGQYLISKWISKNTNIKVLLIGDGSDELTGGYLYFHNAPNNEEFHKENIRLLNDIHYYDVLRADRGVASNGLEARVPFLDHHFVDTYLSIDPQLRRPRYNSEKYLLRQAFDASGLLPNEVLWRRKEAFSDGVSSERKSWYKIIQEDLENKISDEELVEIQNSDLELKPHTKEALYYFRLYSKYYPNQEKIYKYYWLPRWMGDIRDPSARTLNIYNA